MQLSRTFATAGLRYWRESSAAQKLLFGSGSALFVSMIAHGAALAFSGGSIDGPVSFRKAITFAETLGLLCWSTGWLIPFLRLSRREAWLVSGSISGFALSEAFLMSMQVWRGVPSHYNFVTPFDGVVFSATGVGALGLTIVAAGLLWVSFRRPGAPPSVLLSIRAGLAITLFGAAIGVLMSVNAGAAWQGPEQLGARYGANALGHYIGQPEGTVGGNLVLLHAFGVHGLQLVPLAGWLLGYAALSERQRTQLVAGLSLGIAAFLAVLTTHALRGLPLAAIDPLTAALALGSAAATLLCYGLVFVHAARGLRPGYRKQVIGYS